MKHPLKSNGLCVPVLLALCAGPTARGASASGLECAPISETSAWKIAYQGKPVLVYAFNPQKFKPYVKELRTIQGDNILRDAPFDHLHHHALMYAIRVNGINFWKKLPVTEWRNR